MRFFAELITMIIFYISLSLVISFICSMLESIILSVSPSYLAALNSSNPKLYNEVKDLKDNIERPLASILTFNTVAHTIGAAGAGAEAQRLFGNEALTIFSIFLTLIILIFSEIIPKSLGASFWRSLLPLAVYILRPMTMITLPIVALSDKLSKLFGKEQSIISREEISATAGIGLSDGTLKADEYKNIKSLITFTEIDLKEVYTPIEKVFGLSVDTKINDAYELLEKNSFSRILVWGVNPDDIKGYVLRSKILEGYIHKEKNLNSVLRPILISSKAMSLRQLFNTLLKRREHISAIINEDGNFIGIVTLEDLIEHMLGLEIYDEREK